MATPLKENSYARRTCQFGTCDLEDDERGTTRKIWRRIIVNPSIVEREFFEPRRTVVGRLRHQSAQIL